MHRASLNQYVWHLSAEEVTHSQFGLSFSSMHLTFPFFINRTQVELVSIYIPLKSINDEGANFIEILKVTGISYTFFILLNV